LARGCDVFLDASVEAEADGLNLAPTTSTTLAMGIGDALAAALIQARNFRHEDFARYHPGGQLGSNLSLTVRDRLQPLDRVATCTPQDPLRQVIIQMTERPLGAALVTTPQGGLAGIITDGDVRRALLRWDDIRTVTAAHLLTPSPTTVGPDALLHQALALMEHPRPLSVLPVVEGGRLLGLLRIHDIYQPG
jgi:arabinose-5-phosphate isomerase